jgi:uncharacterized protein (TIGR03790 family)
MRSRFWLVACVALLTPAAAGAQTARNVLLVVNEQSADSVRIGDHYARARSLPPTHVVRLQVPVADVIARGDYARMIEGPIGAWLSRHGLQDDILYLVLTKGLPLRVAGVGGRDGTTASVDSELTLLYRRLTGAPVPVIGRVPNPYFHDQRPLSDAQPFTRSAYDLYLVTRLDGFTAEDVLALIDRGMTPSTRGVVVLDERRAAHEVGGDDWLEAAATRLRAMGAADRVMLELTPAAVATSEPVVGYSSWGSNDPANARRRLGLSFVPGAIGALYVSSDARTFTEPPPAWKPTGGSPRNGASPSLAGDLVRDGLTGVGASVSEPYLDGTLRPDVLFPAYLSGFNLAEAFYLSMPYLSWQSVIVGDPLCVPFPRTFPEPDEPSAGIDDATLLPSTFAERRLAVLAGGGRKPEALKLLMRLEALAARGDTSQKESLLVRATDIDPELVGAQLQLAMVYDGEGAYDQAIARYRLVLDRDPQNVIAMNNLAYALAVQKKQPAEALPLAERAYRISRLAVVADTLGWIHHLLGRNDLAAPLLEQAVAATDSADVLIHAAVVALETGDAARARKHLDAALSRDAKLADRADVKALRERLRVPRP